MLEGAGRTTLTTSMLARARDETGSLLLGGALHDDEVAEHQRGMDVALEVVGAGVEGFHGQRLLGWSRRYLRTLERRAALLVVHVEVVLDPRRLVVETDGESLGGRTDQARRVERGARRRDGQQDLLVLTAVRSPRGAEARNDRGLWVRDQDVLDIALDPDHQVLVHAVVPGERHAGVRRRERRVHIPGRGR